MLRADRVGGACPSRSNEEASYAKNLGGSAFEQPAEYIKPELEPNPGLSLASVDYECDMQVERAAQHPFVTVHASILQG